MTTSAVYGAGSAPAIAHLKSRDGIIIYVEDTANTNMWLNLLKKYIPDDTRFNSVTPLGGREKVIDACRHDQAINGKKRLYIIDGDLDLLQGKEEPDLNHLYRLKAYCVENYLLNESALIELARTYDTSIDKKTAETELNYLEWNEGNLKLLKPLFASYAVSNFLQEPKIKTVKHRISGLRDQHPNDDCLCPKRTCKRIYYVYRGTRKNCNKVDTRIYLNTVQKRLEAKNSERLISGKDYIMNLVYYRMRRLFFKKMVPIKDFTDALADKASNEFDPDLSSRLAKICSQSS